MKMQAALWYGPEDMRVEEIDVPEIGPDEVLVKIGSALSCGTDFKLFRQGHALLVKDIPSPFGHELSGTIERVGSQVTGFQVGDRVVAANSAPCGECFYCQNEQLNLCENLEFLNGAYAEYIRIPARIVQKNLYHIPDHLSYREAAFTEPLACVLHCIDRISLKSGDTIGIIGAGTCGLLFAQLGRLYGARVITIGRGDKKLQVAKEMGAHFTFSVCKTELKENIHKLCPGGRGPDVMIDAAGKPETWELATEIVRRGGRVCFYGGCANGTKVALDTHRLHYEEISCFGVFHHTPYHFKKSLQLIVEKKIDVTRLIFGEVKLRELNQLFQKGLADNPLKIAIIP